MVQEWGEQDKVGERIDYYFSFRESVSFCPIPLETLEYKLNMRVCLHLEGRELGFCVSTPAIGYRLP